MNSRDIEKRAYELERALLEFHQELCASEKSSWIRLSSVSLIDAGVREQGMDVSVRIGVKDEQ